MDPLLQQHFSTPVSIFIQHSPLSFVIYPGPPCLSPMMQAPTRLLVTYVRFIDKILPILGDTFIG